jgi:hypothetical protein
VKDVIDEVTICSLEEKNLLWFYDIDIHYNNIIDKVYHDKNIILK